MVYAIVIIGVLQVVFDVVGIWMAWNLHGQSSRRISIVERENVHMAGGIVVAKKDTNLNRQALDQLGHIRSEVDADLASSIEGLNQRLLTLENKQPKIAPRHTRVNFRQFRDAMEKSTEPEVAE